MNQAPTLRNASSSRKLYQDLFPPNPPSVPTLVAVRNNFSCCKMGSWLRRSSFIIDWHNFGYSLLALSLGLSKENGNNKTLILHEIQEDNVKEFRSSKESLAASDVAVFLYDRLKILVTGKGGVGKSSTVNSIIGERAVVVSAFQENTMYE
ncbi:hypothetical protein L2E82_14763 [Cichorium intybus]|uniref:Uncharacterized protein n=1 Tax=Cichorium intybus TaxID=13427 RepID=A0ACB9F0X9_CICIN|nr:hypothetical protein L2E82_14763 [Cichorium intybus]